MSTTFILLSGLAGLGVSLGINSLVLRRAARGRRVPSRGFHHGSGDSKPRYGGIALIVVFGVWILLLLAVPAWRGRYGATELAILGALGAGMFGLGFADDLVGLGAKKKLAGQVFLSVLAWAGGFQIETFTSPFQPDSITLGWLGLPVTVLWLVALPNLINLIDGMDGVAGGISLMTLALLAYMGMEMGNPGQILLATGMVGALMGFLAYNFPPARLYLGDGGAYFLGFLIGLLSLASSQKGTVIAALVAPLIVLALPLLDVSMAILRRGLKGLPLFRPDRRHVHHRMLEVGHSKFRAVLAIYGLTLVLLVTALLFFWVHGRGLPIVVGLVALALLVFARATGLYQDWLSFPRLVSNSVQLRRDVEYGLALGRWLELEGGRGPGLGRLWQDYQFMLSRMGFCRVEVSVGEARRTAELVAAAGNGTPEASMEFGMVMGGATLTLVFSAFRERLDLYQFEHLSELAAEAWHKAASQWCRTRKRDFELAMLDEPEPLVRASGSLRPGSATVSAPRAALPP